jgi:hypothetical protein
LSPHRATIASTRLIDTTPLPLAKAKPCNNYVAWCVEKATYFSSILDIRPCLPRLTHVCFVQTDRRSSVDGRQPTSRHRSPSQEDPRYRYEDLSYSSGAQPRVSSSTRPRPSRTSSNVSTPPHVPSPPDAEGDRGTRSKPTRNTLKKAPRRDSLHADTPSGSQSGQYYEDDDTASYVPRLEQIREGKKSRSSRSQASSTVSSSVEPRTRRRRRAYENAEDRSQSRYKHQVPQRHSDSPLKMSNQSEISVATDIHPESSVSNSSNTTLTQRSYDDRSEDEDSDSEPETYISEASEAPQEMTAAELDSAKPNVFQYMQQVPTVEEYSDEEQDEPRSAAASSSNESSDDSGREGTQSSHTGSSQFVRDTPTTSPASMRQSESDAGHHQPRKYHNAKRPLYASSFVHGHGGQEDEEELEESEGASEEESDDGEEDQDEFPHAPQAPEQNSALQRTSPPRAPSATSRHSDQRFRRLKQQEQELANHILASPQPKKDFQFAGGPSPRPPPAMPLYSPRAYSGASPASFEPTAGYQPEWPQFPPPLPIGYPTQSMLESPTAGHAMPLTVQPPIGVPGMPVQQYPPPFPQHPGQPPQYQAHIPASDMTRATPAGYELLANKLSETPKKSSKFSRRAGSVVPMYRKFEHLNHRVLLHLQDEVCELEEELRSLDDSIAQMSPRDESGQSYPASRRNDARYGGELHYKRTELLGRIFQKLGQYSK